MSADKPSLLYRIIKRCVYLVYRPYEIVGAENLPEEPALIVGNHSQTHGPLAMELYAPRRRYTWCVHEMLSFREVSAYAYRDFWSGKPKGIRWLYRIVSYLIAPLAWVIFNNACVIPVYYDNRLLSTFRETAKRLSEGADVVIFPEGYTPRSSVIYEYREGFASIAAFYRQKAKKNVGFVPMYICPALRKILYGAPTQIDFSKPVKEETERVRQYLMKETERLARSLPPHRVVPYPNLPKKEYPMSK